MLIPRLVIETYENFKEITLFPWFKKSEKILTINYDLIPFKINNKNYFVSLAFPYKYNFIHLEYNSNIFKVNLIHSSNELNIALFQSDEYNGPTFTVNDLKYRIPNKDFKDFYFNNNNSVITHIDYYFKNFNSDNLPPFAYLNVQSDSAYIGSTLMNKSTNTIYGILMTTYDNHIIIPSVAIKRLLDGINKGFKLTNLFIDYKLSEKNNSIIVLKSKYSSIKVNTNISHIDNNMILNGKIKYNKINEWVPIESYLWYEWLPGNSLLISKKKKNISVSLPFIDYNIMCKIPYISVNESSKNIKLSFELLEYFYNKNIILSNKKMDQKLLDPYENNDITLEIDDSIITSKYEEPTEININDIIL